MIYDFELAEELGEELGNTLLQVIKNVSDFYNRCLKKTEK